MTYNEQLMLDRIKRYGIKYLYVVHNSINFESKEQVENYIEDTLKNEIDCDLKEQEFDRTKEANHNHKYYTETINIDGYEKIIIILFLQVTNLKKQESITINQE
jgi:hypothetical protein